LDDYQGWLDRIFSGYDGVNPAPFTAFSAKSQFKILSDETKARTALESIGILYKEHSASIIDDRNKRISFGLPLQRVDEKTRRASPLFIHIHPIAGNKFVPVAIHLPTNCFHHDNRYQRINFTDVSDFVGGLS
jgi:CRISPR/Cas system CMR-associated protein Cmr1 (group 7 of RAMP superfamily)